MASGLGCLLRSALLRTDLRMDGRLRRAEQAAKKLNKPAAGSDIHLNKGFKQSIKTIEKTAASHFYRPDLRKAAIARYAALYHDQRVKKNVGKRAAASIKKGRTSKRTA